MILVLPITDGLTGKEKPLALQPQVSLGQDDHGSCPAPCCCSQYEAAALGDLVCAHAPTSLTAEPAPNWLGDVLPLCVPLSQGLGYPSGDE